VLTVGSGVAVTQPGPAPCQFGDCQGPAARHQAAPVDRVGPVDRRRRTTAPPGGHRRPIRARRGIDDGRRDQPFNYNGSWVTPVFNPDFNNWRFWFLVIWIPLQTRTWCRG
jgi:hypothetical protein